MFVGELNWTKNGLNLNELQQDTCPLAKTNIKDFHDNYEVVFIDTSGYLNICSNLDKTTFDKSKYEAKICTSFINNEPEDCLDKLFIKNYPVEMYYDALIKICPLDFSFYSNLVEKTSTQTKLLDYFNNSYCVALKAIKTSLFKAIENRTSLIYVKTIEDIKV